MPASPLLRSSRVFAHAAILMNTNAANHATSIFLRRSDSGMLMPMVQKGGRTTVNLCNGHIAPMFGPNVRSGFATFPGVENYVSILLILQVICLTERHGMYGWPLSCVAKIEWVATEIKSRPSIGKMVTTGQYGRIAWVRLPGRHRSAKKKKKTTTVDGKRKC